MYLLKVVRSIAFIGFIVGFFSWSSSAAAQGDSVAGLYKAVLLHEGTDFYQYANITLRTVNVNGQIRISSNVKVLYGDWNSNEFLTYEFAEVPLNILTRQISIRADENDVSMIGFLRDGTIEGEWYSSQVGRVGTFHAVKGALPNVPADGVLVRTLSGFYRGELVNTNPQSNLPERLTMSFVTTQDTTSGRPVVKISGNARFYLGDFDSQEYVETPFTDVQFNFYSRYLTAKTQEFGITFKGTMTPDGLFDGAVLSDGLGEVGTISMTRYPPVQ